MKRVVSREGIEPSTRRLRVGRKLCPPVPSCGLARILLSAIGDLWCLLPACSCRRCNRLQKTASVIRQFAPAAAAGGGAEVAEAAGLVDQRARQCVANVTSLSDIEGRLRGPALSSAIVVASDFRIKTLRLRLPSSRMRPFWRAGVQAERIGSRLVSELAHDGLELIEVEPGLHLLSEEVGGNATFRDHRL